MGLREKITCTFIVLLPFICREVFEESGAVILTNGQLRSGSPSRIARQPGNSRPFGRPLPSSPDADTLNPDKGPGVEYESATRPPLAGPYAFSTLPRPVDNLPKIYLTNDLPETWLFLNVTTDGSGLASIPVEAPELANSSWVISGFSLDTLSGMGISEQMQTLEIFQPFFVKVDLPHSVKRGETLAVQVSIRPTKCALVLEYMQASFLHSDDCLQLPEQGD